MDWTQLILGLTSSGAIGYLLIEKFFSRKKDSAEAHQAMVVSFDKEMEALRKIRLDMIEDVSTMRIDIKAQQKESEQSLNTQITLLKSEVTRVQSEAARRESVYLEQFKEISKTVHTQAKQINKMVSYWQLLCDKEDCKDRNTPRCPFNE